MPNAGDKIRASDLVAELDYDEITATPAEITALVDLGPSVTFTLSETRRVMLTTSTLISSTSANDVFNVLITDSANTVQSYAGSVRIDIASQQYRVQFSVRLSLAAGEHTYKTRAQASTSVGTTTCPAAATNPAWLQAMDCGPG